MKKLIAVLFILSNAIGLNSQWVEIPTPNAGSCFAISSSGEFIFAGTYKYQNSQLYFSSNYGLTWQETSLNNIVYTIVCNGSNIFIGCADYGVYRSTNFGQNWTQTVLNNETVDLTPIL